MLGMKILLPIILVVGGAGFAYHKVVINEKDNRIAQQQMDIAACTQQKLALDAASEINSRTIDKLEKQMKQQAQEFAKLTQQNSQLEKDKNRYVCMVRRHNLTERAQTEAADLEPRVNRATDRVFRQVEADSRELDEADDSASERAYDSNK